MFKSDTVPVKRVNGFSIFAFVILSVAAFSAGAADKGSQFGVVWGLSVPDADNTNTFNLFGVKGAAIISPQFSTGGYYLTSNKAGELSDTQKFRYSLTGVQAAYHMPASGGDTFFALRIGMTKLQKNISPSLEGTFSPYHYGIATGYDYYLGESFSMGFEGSYLHVLPGRTNISGTDHNQDSFNIINFLISLQLRL